MKFSATILGAKELSEGMYRATGKVNDELDNAVMRAAYFAEGRAKQYAPIKYGVLRGSINTQGITGSLTNRQAVVGTNVSYAPFQEFGTKRGIKPKLYFTRAKDEALPKLAEYMREALQNIINIIKR